MANVLIIDDDRSMCGMMVELVKNMGHHGVSAVTLNQGIDEAMKGEFDVIFLDVLMPDGNGLEILPVLKDTRSAPEVIIVTGAGTSDGAEVAIKNGAWDYLQKPLSPKKILLPLSRVFQYRDSLKKISRPPVALKLRGIIGSSAAIRECYDFLAQAANSHANVLITGETGTGKELFAKAIHANSTLADQKFVVVDCAALPESLIESSLFGHEKGAFTGADKSREGLIKLADGGTLFLDEIGELGPMLQKTFLRVLQERKFRPIGSENEISSNFRLIAATNKNLGEMAVQRTFRKDLLYRLQSLVIELPPLRERIEDVKDIAVFHTAKICERYGTETKGFSTDFFQVLQAYEWEGNVRELTNALESAISAAFHEPILFPKHLPINIRVKMARASVSSVENVSENNGIEEDFVAEHIPTYRDFRDAVLADCEKKYFKELLLYTRGNVTEACRISGLGRTWLYTVLKKYDILRMSSAGGKSRD
jgi:two-component system NtrC family response regulator